MIAVNQQDQIEVFMNEAGSISIKQIDGFGDESIVVLWHTHAQAVIDALIRVAREASDAALEDQDA